MQQNTPPPSRLDWKRITHSLTGLLRQASESPDATHKIELYQFVGEALARNLSLAPDEAYGWLLDALVERDPKVLASFAARRAPTPEAAQRLSRALLELRVVFRREGVGRRWLREYTAYLLGPSNPLRAQRTDEVDWDDLPDEVRDLAMRARRTEVAFKLWPFDAGER
jgi:hypothetical protein